MRCISEILFRRAIKIFNGRLKKILKLACVSDALGLSDYALELLKYLTLKHGSDERFNFYATIIDSFNQIPELVEQGVDTLEVVAQLKASSSQ